MSGVPTLYSYWRSSASYRVRIALALKGVGYDLETVSLVDGAQREADYLAINPQGVLPAFRTDDGEILTQSLAIMEYLEEACPGTSRLLPGDPVGRARARAFAAVIACDTHPVQNLSVLNCIRADHGQDEEGVARWCRCFISRGLAALEPAAQASDGPFLFGDAPGLAECCLVPQVYNARRWGVDMSAFPALEALDQRCLAMDAFQAAAPETQPDAPEGGG